MENRRNRASTAGSDWKQSLRFFRPLAATDPEQTVEPLESRRCSPPPATRKLPFDFQQCYSCLTGSFEGGAASVCGMGSVGNRPGAAGEVSENLTVWGMLFRRNRTCAGSGALGASTP